MQITKQDKDAKKLPDKIYLNAISQSTCLFPIPKWLLTRASPGLAAPLAI